jgi:hypothetical protein
MSQSLPPDLSAFERYSMPATECRLSESLGLAWDAQMQDWDLVNANPGLLHRLASILKEPASSADERFSAMCLAIASYDELLLGGAQDAKLWSLLESEMIQHPELYASVVWYWAQPAPLGEEESFLVSPAMESVWQHVKEKLRSGNRSDA